MSSDHIAREHNKIPAHQGRKRRIAIFLMCKANGSRLVSSAIAAIHLLSRGRI